MFQTTNQSSAIILSSLAACSPSSFGSNRAAWGIRSTVHGGQKTPSGKESKNQIAWLWGKTGNHGFLKHIGFSCTLSHRPSLGKKNPIDPWAASCRQFKDDL